MLDRLARDLVQPHGAHVIAQARPGADGLGDRRGGQIGQRRELFQEGAILRQHALDLRLLEHHLGDEDGVGVAGLAPGQMRPPLGGIPRQQRAPHLLPPLFGYDYVLLRRHWLLFREDGAQNGWLDVAAGEDDANT